MKREECAIRHYRASLLRQVTVIFITSLLLQRHNIFEQVTLLLLLMVNNNVVPQGAAGQRIVDSYYFKGI